MNYAACRHSMVENQIRTNRVTDPLVIDAMNTVPREAFVPAELKGVAYLDEDIPLGGGRHLMEPLVIARLLQAAEIKSEDVILDIGCGTGYVSAVMASMASVVVALESDTELAARANAAFATLGLDTVAVVEGPFQEGYVRQAPYDVIFFGGSVARIPDAIADQLAEGGRMVAVVTDEQGIGVGSLYLRAGGGVSRREVFNASTPYLPGFEPVREFTF
jgi:protein-L-isoaspartate(D-aspartate) O-methyltransferase